jgi:hypothetical protein
MQFIGCATLLDIDRKCYVGFAKTDLGLGKQSTNGAVGARTGLCGAPQEQLLGCQSFRQ